MGSVQAISIEVSMSYWLEVLKSEKPQKAKGKVLDQFGKLYGLERKRYFFFFKEFDKNYRKRLVDLIKYGPKENGEVIR